MSVPKVFISYPNDDLEWVRQFAEALQKFEVEVWLDEWRIPAGASIRGAVDKGLRESDAIIAIISQSNVSRPNVFFELGAAIGTGKRLIPIVSQDVENRLIPFDLRLLRHLAKGSPNETARDVAKVMKEKEENNI